MFRFLPPILAKPCQSFIWFFFRIHHGTLLNSSKALPVIDKLKDVCGPKLNAVRVIFWWRLFKYGQFFWQLAATVLGCRRFQFGCLKVSSNGIDGQRTGSVVRRSERKIETEEKEIQTNSTIIRTRMIRTWIWNFLLVFCMRLNFIKFEEIIDRFFAFANSTLSRFETSFNLSWSIVNHFWRALSKMNLFLFSLTKYILAVASHVKVTHVLLRVSACGNV